MTKEEEHIAFLCEARNNDIIPIAFQLKASFPGKRSERILNNASKALIRSQISFHRWKKSTLQMDALQRFEEIKEHTLEEDYSPIFAKIDVTCSKLRDQLKSKHQKKLLKLKPVDNTRESANNRRNIINISNKNLSPEEEQLLSKGLNFAVTPKQIPTLEVIAAVETIRLPQPQADEFRHQIRTVLDQQKTTTRNITKSEEKALQQLQKDKSIKILPADKGNATVIMDTETYDSKLNDVLAKGDYRLLEKDPTQTIEGRIYRTLKKYAEYIPDTVRFKLTPHNSKPPHLYGLPKIHKNNMPLRPITSSRDSPTSALSKYLLDIIQPLQGNSASFVKNSIHFVEILKTVNLNHDDRFVSFDVESLYTNVPIDESLDIIREKLRTDATLTDRTDLPVDGVMDLLECCLRNSYFQVKNDFYSQDNGLPMGSSLSPVVANIYMEWFEEEAINSAELKPKLWLRYVDDTFIVWENNDEELEKFLHHINNIRPSISFTMEKEKDACLPFLDVLVKRIDDGIRTEVYRKPTHTGQYLNNDSNHSAATKQGIIRTLYDRARNICSNPEELDREMENIKNDLKQNGYSDKKIIQTISRARNQETQTNSERIESSGFLTIPYVKGMSEKVRRIARNFNIKTAFKSDKTLRSVLTRTKPEKSGPNKDCVYQVQCECGDSYIGETKRPLETRIKEHRKHTQQGNTDKSGIADHVWTNQHRMKWSEAKVVHREQHWQKRKFIEAAFIEQNNEVFSKPSVDIPNIWKPLLAQERYLKLHGPPSEEAGPSQYTAHDQYLRQ